jgi:hypothetical protein
MASGIVGGAIVAVAFGYVYPSIAKVPEGHPDMTLEDLVLFCEWVCASLYGFYLFARVSSKAIGFGAIADDEHMAAVAIAKVPLLFILPPAAVVLFANGKTLGATIHALVFVALVAEYLSSQRMGPRARSSPETESQPTNGSSEASSVGSGPDAISCSWSWHPSVPGIVVLKYSGKYGYGSAGNPDCRRMLDHAESVLGSNECAGVIVDITGLRYEWGDMFGMLCGVGAERGTPSVLLTSDLNAPALRSLLEERFSEFCVASDADAVAVLKSAGAKAGQ